MQTTLKNRETITGATTIYTPPVDVSSASLLTFTLTVHAVSGAAPSLGVAFETSENLEDWKAVGAPANQDSVGTAVRALSARTQLYGRYVRAAVTVGGTVPMYNFSLWVNTFPDS